MANYICIIPIQVGPDPDDILYYAFVVQRYSDHKYFAGNGVWTEALDQAKRFEVEADLVTLFESMGYEVEDDYDDDDEDCMYEDALYVSA
ncbi:hypothetical protein A3K34_04310 [candidate division WWE3 bacterium RIFOXYC1_FULL_40_10]|uniref:Uncharacterized protein n=1 Tax=candidate division WWE3 bacterium RIFOXYA2_FULL_46_9 TaxID=1802636 RepID=A0A1F4W146_UNCKA|nr:MAG: hypothetical protein A3K58_04310 [candidate division WWE3 bacterium RIFOXYB1_FULL_40_22]OGC62065.1 MAG: hypothetical protein A3K37_04310 [candidate division WWE3 bacterium RIFOXYA1_FULL_40_11]OGC63080.1 MAG: hypothetical protein A2264_00055 [candidate division WWE3 bacterium RIFOXYA2_FULL_46_9]OGC64990.1 MAG: hypothetical protein A2326_03055 [candidate division WWE3 bacterium RIFOXYB2_FULL_41_6]OGC66448.1 MAG: hypothetical protein A3K34_04310 [candidate division WWE3 bacterium RIFOXYC1_